MEEEFSKIKFKMSMYVPDNASRSLIIPEKDNDKICYKMFTYYALVREDVIKIYDIESIIEEKNGEIQVQKLDDVSRLIEIHRINKISRDEGLELEVNYYDQLTRVIPILYKSDLTDEERTIAKEFKNTFNKLVLEDMQKLYEEYFPNFMTWIKNI